MSLFSKAAIWGGTAASAFAIGFFMQTTSDSAGFVRAAAPVVAQQMVTPPFGATDVDDFALMELRDITLTSAIPDVITPDRLPDPLPDDMGPGQGHAATTGCDISVSARVETLARVELTVDAPCNTESRVTVRHSGLAFSDLTDARGHLKVIVPALSQTARFVVEFDDGRDAETQAQVAGLDRYQRVALQWRGENSLQLHAREDGAGFGEAGHVWTQATYPGAGVVVPLGTVDTEAPLLAQIYSIPRSDSERPDIVSISVEAEVTEANCNREVTAQSLEMRGNGPIRSRDLVLSMPDCDATGEFLVLNNLVADLKIAAE